MRTCLIFGAVVVSLSLAGCGSDSATAAGPAGVWVVDEAMTKQSVEDNFEPLVVKKIEQMVNALPEAARGAARERMEAEMKSPASKEKMKKEIDAALTHLGAMKIEFKSDGTYEASLPEGDGKMDTNTGKWRLSGDQIEVEPDGEEKDEGTPTLTYSGDAVKMVFNAMPGGIFLKRQ